MTEPKQPIPPEWLAEFEAVNRRPLKDRLRYAFIKTYKPVRMTQDSAPLTAWPIIGVGARKICLGGLAMGAF